VDEQEDGQAEHHGRGADERQSAGDVAEKAGRHRIGLGREFLKLWLGQSVSLLGNQFTQLALPIAAAVTLHATALEMGLLGAMRFAPAILVGLPAGVRLDRTRRKPVLVASQVVSALALITIPAAALVHVLSIGQLYAVAFVAGAAATVQGIALVAIVPTIAGRDRLVPANTRIQTSLTVANLLGPGAAGAAIQAFTAPLAIAFDAASFAIGALTSAWARADENIPATAGGRHLSDALEGQSWLWRQPLVRSIGLTLVINNAGTNVTFAVFVLYFVTRVGITPAQLGIVFAVGGLSSLLGARLSRPLVDRGWLGPVMAVGAGLVVIGQAGSLFAAYAPPAQAFWILLVFSAVLGCSLMVYNVNQQSIRQAVTPDRLMGRVQSGLFVLVAVAQVAGSLLGGAIGQVAGLRAAIGAGVLICLTSALPSVLSPLRRLTSVPAAATG
jgi:MFS family permease